MNFQTCPNCKMRVFPKSDGTCPSCQSIIPQKEKGSISKSIEPNKNSETSTHLKQEPFQINEKDNAAGFCHHCGKPFLSSDNFCTKCGTPRRATIVEQAPPTGFSESSHFPISSEQYDGNKDIVKRYFEQANEYHENSEYEKALKECDRVIELAPDWSKGHNLRGVILEELGNLQEAITEYRIAVRLNPTDKDASQNLALALKEGAKRGKKVWEDNSKGQLREVTKAVTVSTKYYSSFNMPPYCVMCGNTPGQGTMQLERSQSSFLGGRTETMKMDFPLCQECSKVWAKKSSCFQGLVTWIGILLILGIAFFAIIVLSGDAFALFLGGILILAIILFLGWWSKRNWTPEEWERRKRIVRCVKIITFKTPGLFDKSGYIGFQFENPLFAEEFSHRNNGHIF
jgi:hypothetical protein